MVAYPAVTKYLVVLGMTGVLLNIVLWVGTLWLFAEEQPAAILHYTVASGIDFIGPSTQIKGLPLSGTVLLIGNAILGAAIYRADRRLSWILWGVIPVLQVVLGVALFLLWRVNS